MEAMATITERFKAHGLEVLELDGAGPILHNCRQGWELEEHARHWTKPYWAAFHALADRGLEECGVGWRTSPYDED